MRTEITVDVAIIGAGTAGLYALREVRRAGRSFVLIDHGPLGTTCARVGCMPSKLALHAADLWQSRLDMPAIGVAYSEALQLDNAITWAALRKQRDFFSNNAANKARAAAGKQLIEGRARFLEPTLLEVESAEGTHVIRAGAVIIATGSRPFIPDWLAPFADRIVTTDTLFEMAELPARIGVLGLGALGLEMGLALSRLGIEVTAAGGSSLAGIDDPQVAARAVEVFSQEMLIWLGQPASVERAEHGLVLRSGERCVTIDLLLVATGRRANTDELNLQAAGFTLQERGEPLFDPATLQLDDWPVYIAGDANGQRALMHEAADEGAIAGYNAARTTPTRFRQKTSLSIAFAKPDVATIGKRLSELEPSRIIVGSASGEANGRLRILGGERSLLNIYADSTSGLLLGASLLSIDGEHLAHQLAWAIQRGETAQSLLQMPFYHPVVEELLATALQEIAKHFTDPQGLPLGLSAEE